MKQLISAIKRTQIQRQILPLFKKSTCAAFSTNTKKLGEDITIIDPKHYKMLEEEKELFDKLSEKEKNYYQAERLLYLQYPQEMRTDNKLWWNKIQTMSEEELRLLPDSFVMKFGSFLHRIRENKMDSNLQNNKSFDMYDKAKNLDQLQTDEEVRLITEEKDKLREGDRSHKYEKEGYMLRQPRLDLTKYNYNFEQFKEYTALYDECKKKDQADLKNFYKMVKYSIQKLNKGDRSAISFAKKYRLDLIEIPEEFKDVSIQDVEIKKDRRTRRPFIRVKSNNLRNYDAWRCHDRELIKSGGKMACACKIMLPPALLVRAFGLPVETRTGFDGSGEYDFEDVNLDCYNIADYKQTDFYWGLNREDEYYEKYISLPLHKRRRKWPSVKEFWESMEPKEFKVYCQDHADIRKFRAWIRKAVKQSVKREISFDEEINSRFGKEVDISLGKYDEVGIVNTDIAIFNWDFTYHMTEEEIKKLKEKPEKLVAPKAFDLSMAERVIITKEEIKARELLEQEKLKNI